MQPEEGWKLQQLRQKCEVMKDTLDQLRLEHGWALRICDGEADRCQLSVWREEARLVGIANLDSPLNKVPILI